MITRLRAQNFKSWKDTGDLRIAPLTGLFGTNSSGKTSILQALLVLKQSAEYSPAPRRVLNLGDDSLLLAWAPSRTSSTDTTLIFNCNSRCRGRNLPRRPAWTPPLPRLTIAFAFLD
jgi:hypothetical protein